jgi:hypothetical protein
VLLRRSSLPPRITSKTLAFYVDGLLVCCASLSWHARIAGNGIYSIGDSAGGERAPEMCDSQVSEQAVDCGDVTRDLGMIFLGFERARPRWLKHRCNPTAVIAPRRLTGIYPILLVQRATGAN